MSAVPSGPDRPALRVVRGEPTAEELAVVAALMTAAGTTAPAESPAPARGRWNDPAAAHRSMPRHGPGGWRAVAH